jgi:hypothetical protein
MVERGVLLDVPIQMMCQMFVIIHIFQHGIFPGVKAVHEVFPGAVVIVCTAVNDECPFWRP